MVTCSMKRKLTGLGIRGLLACGKISSLRMWRRNLKRTLGIGVGTLYRLARRVPELRKWIAEPGGVRTQLSGKHEPGITFATGSPFNVPVILSRSRLGTWPATDAIPDERESRENRRCASQARVMGSLRRR